MTSFFAQFWSLSHDNAGLRIFITKSSNIVDFSRTRPRQVRNLRVIIDVADVSWRSLLIIDAPHVGMIHQIVRNVWPKFSLLSRTMSYSSQYFIWINITNNCQLVLLWLHFYFRHPSHPLYRLPHPPFAPFAVHFHSYLHCLHIFNISSETDAYSLFGLNWSMHVPQVDFSKVCWASFCWCLDGIHRAQKDDLENPFPWCTQISKTNS